MKKIWIVSNLEKGVGISKYVMDTYSRISDQTENLEFIFVNDQEKNDYVSDLKRLGIVTINIPKLTRHPLGYLYHWTLLLFKNHRSISAIHFHYDSMVRFYPILLACLLHVNNIIVHSHNASSSVVMDSKIRYMLHVFGRNLLRNKIKYRFAVSDKAADWLYGTSKNVRIIHNGVDVKRFRYSDKKRKKLRAQMNWKDKFVVGHIGRFKSQKNHIFLIKVFSRLLKKIPNAHLVLIGEGPLENKVKLEAVKLGIDESVSFLGQRSNVDELIDAMDMMIFPSLYEGFPITMVEAQCSGLPILYSDTITKSVELIPTTESESLNKSVDTWAEKAFLLSKIKITRKNSGKKIIAAGYDLATESSKLMNFYLKLK